MTKTKPEIVVAGSGRKLAIVYQTAGVHFATYAQLRAGRTIVASTDDRPYGFVSAAREDALKLAKAL